ncbi:hypothetical protein N658DRAFT_497809 [Parathielavia hyrcaniae]|uniref:Uncharacterized protein n=1 Tax=Parathielavia hyrcaniae TaxID=113614 RepID=A0AAN6Q353_9PEZI|nr:hypothetical protein N658DRAFT_497809 [Parathielavia hyrcaniae]
MHERPMTPTPYSVLRKVSETSEPGNEDEGEQKDNKQPSSVSHQPESTPQPSVIQTPRDPDTAAQLESRSHSGIAAKKTAVD